MTLNAVVRKRDVKYPLCPQVLKVVHEEEDKIKWEKQAYYVIIDIGTVGSIDTSGITMLEEVQKNVDRKGLKV
ncbi:hypothetical protein C1H46_042905 [Malus baccata]|uniref:STAS domain-containing protein n=1 Tax=Malus baccata TaxID=106549 RepID=A0A540KBG7_MALBA|nr:hypothetical protein C1H46_042905 [Malus baccata]